MVCSLALRHRFATWRVLRWWAATAPGDPPGRPRRRPPPMSTRSSLASAKPTKSKPAALPEWNLADLYPALDAPEVKADLDRVDADCQAFEETYNGRLPDMARAAGAGRRPAAAANG